MGWKVIGSPARAAPLDRNDSSSPGSALAAPDPRFEIEHLGLPAGSEPQQEVRCQECDVMAGGAIDLDKIATPLERLFRSSSYRVTVAGERMGMP